MPNSSAMRTKKILLIEDSPDLSFLYKKSLSSLGYEIEHCSSGHSALHALDSFTPDLIVMDLTLGDMAIQDFHTLFFQKSSVDKVPLLLISGREDLMTWAAEFKAAFAAKKPIDLGQFRKAVQELIQFDEDPDALTVPASSPSHLI